VRTRASSLTAAYTFTSLLVCSRLGGATVGGVLAAAWAKHAEIDGGLVADRLRQWLTPGGITSMSRGPTIAGSPPTTKRT
jgi:hypothetical protein